jgi:hypothetical protein
MTAFEEYLALYEIDPVRLSMEAKVRYLIIYNAKKGLPILSENAQKIKDAVAPLWGNLVHQQRQKAKPIIQTAIRA